MSARPSAVTVSLTWTLKLINVVFIGKMVPHVSKLKIQPGYFEPGEIALHPGAITIICHLVLTFVF